VDIYNCYQYSTEWWKLREKRLSASHAQAIGNAGKGLKTYVEQLMSEYYSKAEKESFSNKHTARGAELEDSAGTVYSFRQNIEVEKVGFVTYNDYVGCSPDLLAGGNGLAEIKCPDDKGHFALLIGGEFESKYKWQCQMQMFICEKDWCDLISYNPNFNEYLIVRRQVPDKKKVAGLIEGFAAGEKLIKEIIVKMEG